jgi:hypothetical protein
LRRVEKSREEVKKIELRWEEMKQLLRAVEKSCEN